MGYTLYITPTARRKWKKLPRDVKGKIESKLKILRNDPYTETLDIKKLQNSPYHRLRVGNYRIIYDVVNNELIIRMLDVGHRKYIY